MTLRWVSIYDLLEIEESREALLKDDEESLKSQLWTSGFDVDELFELQVCLHRQMFFGDKKPVYGIRFISRERVDQWWVDSEHCTLENKLEIIGTKDLEFQKQLVGMYCPPNFTAMACDHLKENSLEGI